MAARFPSLGPPAAGSASTPRARGLRVDPALVCVACLALGAAAASRAAPTLVAAALGVWALRERLGRAAAVTALLCICVGWARASSVLGEHARRHAAARSLLPAPGRCAATARVTSSPALVEGRLRFGAELSGLDCEGRLDGRRWSARLYAPWEPALAVERGSELSVIADLAPVSAPHNFDLPDPRPRAARDGAVLSGAPLWLEVTRPAAGPGALVDRARAHVRRRILATFPPPVAGMARALVLGENDLTEGDERAFQRSGLAHLLAVSGTHLVLAVLALVRALEALLRRITRLSARADVRRPAALLGLCLAPLYADFAGGSGSAWRAAFMLCAVLGTRAIGRHPFPSRVLAHTLALGWAGDALLVHDPSFLLSIAATTGLLLLGQRLDKGLLQRSAALVRPRRADLRRLTRALAGASLTTLAATLPCVPVLLSISPGLSLASLAANVLAAPLGEALALPLCLAHALSAPAPSLERGLALTASGALALIRSVALASASVDWLYIELPPPTPWHLACLGAALPLCLAPSARPWRTPRPPRAPTPPTLPSPTTASRVTALSASPAAAGSAAPSRSAAPSPAAAPARSSPAPLPRVLLAAAALLLVEAATRLVHSAAWHRHLGRLRVTSLDVGQGDATLVDLPDGRLLLIDGGGAIGPGSDPGARVIVPTLRARRRHHLDLLVLTHAHPDHLEGLHAVVQAVSVGELWYGGVSTAERASPSFERLRATLARRGVPLRGPEQLCAAPAHRVGRAQQAQRAATLHVLHPCPLAPEQNLNDNSLVLRLTHGRHAALLTGDAERWAEERLLATHPESLHADYLKVGHHGSRTSSSPAFLAQVHPRIAVLSSGPRNRFGHPHPETLSHLHHAGAAPYRIDQHGAVQWRTDGVTDSVRAARPADDAAPPQPAGHPTRPRRRPTPPPPRSAPPSGHGDTP